MRSPFVMTMTKNTEMTWTTEWPTKPGTYLCYGRIWWDKSPQMVFVRAHDSSTGLCLVGEGCFVYPTEVQPGMLWADFPLPSPPANYDESLACKEQG